MLHTRMKFYKYLQIIGFSAATLALIISITVGVQYAHMSKFTMKQVEFVPHSEWTVNSLINIDTVNVTHRRLTDIDNIIIHHTATDFSVTPQYLELIHVKRRQFSMIGYHFLISNDGIVFEGRSLNLVGAHVLERNANSIGIALIGNFNDHFPSINQLSSLSALTRELKMSLNIQNVSIEPFE